MDRPVVIVGGGPVGLATAVLLGRQGVPSIVLEQRQEGTDGRSKAVTVQQDVLAILDRIGIAADILVDGSRWSVGRTYYRERELFVTRFADINDELYPPFVNFPQWRTEVLLRGEAERTGFVQIKDGRTVTRIEQDDHEVTIHASTDRGPETYCCRYAVGADGVRSTVRSALGIDYQGGATKGRFLVCDFAAQLPFSSERRLWFDPPFHPDGIVLMHRFGEHQWRLDWQIDTESDDAPLLTNEALRERLSKVVGDLEVNILRANTYTFEQRQAEKFQCGRVFLAGDAAHVVSPFGGRGLNCGFEDADNLAWKLGFVLNGRADDRLTDTYQHERGAAAAHHVAVTGETMLFMVPPTTTGVDHRNGILTDALLDPGRATEVNSGKLYQPYPYLSSPLTADLDGCGSSVPPDVNVTPPAGALMPDGACHTPTCGPTTFRKLLGGDVSVVAVPRSSGTATGLARRLTNLSQPPPERRYLLGASPAGATNDANYVPVWDETGALATSLAGSVDQLLVVRPDCYLAVRVRHSEIAADSATLVNHAIAIALATTGQKRTLDGLNQSEPDVITFDPTIPRDYEEPYHAQP